MIIKRDGIALCPDCMDVAVHGTYHAIDEYYGLGPAPGQGKLRPGAVERAAQVDEGLARLGPHLVPAFDSETGRGCHEFSWRPCDCCGSTLGGSRHEFAVLEAP